MIGKSVLSVPGCKHTKDSVSLVIVVINHSGELVVNKTGTAHGAVCRPSHGHHGWTPTDTTATDVRHFEAQVMKNSRGIERGEDLYEEVQVSVCGDVGVKTQFKLSPCTHREDVRICALGKALPELGCQGVLPLVPVFEH